VELSALVSQPVGSVDVSAESIFTPENAGDSGRGFYLALAAGRQITDVLSLSLHVGRQWIEREEIAGPDYHDWGVSLEWLHEKFEAVLRYADTDNDACADLCDARVVGELRMSF
jgi:hypothetical protein